MKILITGDVDYKKDNIVDMFKKLQNEYPNNEIFKIIYFGNSRGVDRTINSKLRKLKNTVIIKYKAKNAFLKSKKLRNDRVLKFDRPQLIWIFHEKIEKCTALKDLIVKAERRNIPVNIYE